MTPQTPRRRSLGDMLGNSVQSSAAANPIFLWSELCPRIKEGLVIPIIGNALYSDRIFRPLFDQLFAQDDVAQDDSAAANSVDSAKILITPNIDELLASEWAKQLSYPLADHAALARVAQFCQVKSVDETQAKRGYLIFLKKMLLDVLEKVESESSEATHDLRRQSNERDFSAIASDLSLPRGLQANVDPLRLLARLNLPIYVTTSYYDFMERALEAEGRKPRTQICGEISNLASEHRIERDFVPSVQTPVVYHLHGLERYPASLVLSEDDFLKFLVRVTQPTDPEKPTIPLYLSEKLAESTLLLLGYRLQDWDFRTTFRGLINAKDAPRRSFSLAIQLDPAEQGEMHNPQEAQRYLTDYFRVANFRVEWGRPEAFVQKLWGEWNRWRQGEL